MDYPPADLPPEESFASSSKRKREAPQAPNPWIPFTQEQLDKKFHHLQKTLVAGAKKAQAFETQRLIKKIAQLKKKNDDLSSPEILDLSTQLTELKTVLLAPLTLLSLRTRLSKQHLLTTYPILALIVLPPPLPHDELKSKPANRILSSKTFAKEIVDAVKTVRLWMDPEEREKEKEKLKEERRVERRGGPVVERTLLGGALVQPKAGPSISSSQPQQKEQDKETDDRVIPRGNAELYYEPGDEEASGSQPSGSEDEDEDESDDDGASQASWSSGSVSSSAPPPSKKSKAPPPPPAADGKPAKKKKISTSTFLPSLSSGFIAGSDSEPEELSDGENGRKNRRGQRARKAIWEKKYGSAANHLKARTAQFTEATRGRDSFLASRGGSSHADTGYSANPITLHSPSNQNPYPRGGASSRGGDRGGRAGRGRGGFGAGGGDRPEYVPGMGPPPKTYKSSNFPGGKEAAAAGGGRGGFTGAAVGRGGATGGGAPKKKAEESFAGMHPSWIAKQKQKEKEAALGMGGEGAPKGKKVVFD